MTDDPGSGGEIPPLPIPPEAADFANAYDALAIEYEEVGALMDEIVLAPEAEPCEWEAGPDACDPNTPEGELADLQRKQAEILGDIAALLDEMDAAGVGYPWHCSTHGYDAELTEQPSLPAEVAVTRRTVFEAALECDWEALSPVVGSATVAQWRREEMLPPGARPMEHLVDTLMRSYGTYENGDAVTVFVWPAAATAEEWDAVPEEEREILVAMYGEQIAAAFAEWGYIGHRVAIGEDGAWLWWMVGT